LQFQFTTLIVVLAMILRETKQLALEGGLLDMLLRIYIVIPTVRAFGAEKRGPLSALLASCKSVLEVLCTCSLHTEVVCNHPVYDIWLRGSQLHFSCILTFREDSLEDRCVSRRRTSPHLVKGRLITIWGMAGSDNDDHGCAEFLAYVDAVEFSQ
jgi:hypothetical protein